MGPWVQEPQVSRRMEMAMVHFAFFVCKVGIGPWVSGPPESVQMDIAPCRKVEKKFLAGVDSSVPYYRSEKTRFDGDGERSQQDVGGDRIWS